MCLYLCVHVCLFAYVCMHVLWCMFAGSMCICVHTRFHMHVFTCMLYVDVCAHWSRGAIQWRAISSFGEAVINSYAVTGHVGLVLRLLVTTCP